MSFSPADRAGTTEKGKRRQVTSGLFFLAAISFFLVWPGARGLAGTADEVTVLDKSRIIDALTPEKEFWKLRGPVQKVVETTVRYHLVDGEWSQWIPDEYIRPWIRTYDRYGRLQTNGDNELTAWFCRTYDGRDRILRVTRCDDDGTDVFLIARYGYEGDDLVTKSSIRHLGNGVYSEEELRQRYRRDSDHRPIEIVTYYPDGKIQERSEYVYDGMGRLIEEKRFLSESDPQEPYERLTYQYGSSSLTERTYWGKSEHPGGVMIEQFNSHGDVIEQQLSDLKDLAPSLHTFTYEYDLQGNWIKKTEFTHYLERADQQAMEWKSVTQRILTYYPHGE